MVLGDILDFDSLVTAIDKCDVVYNFAGISDLNDALTKPVDTVRLNILGNVNILEACRKAGVSRLLYASTVYVYSREGGFYRCSKQAAEHYVEEYQRVYGLDFTILRYGSLYGPRSGEGNGLYRVIKRALAEGTVSYEGSSHALREYIHVEDAARASVIALGDEFRNESITLSGQEPMRVIDLLEMVAEILGLRKPIDFVEGSQIGHYVRTPYAYQPKLGTKLTLSKHVDLGQGLLQLMNYVRLTEGINLHEAIK
jgi:UDP-glucose 4-epimerase